MATRDGDYGASHYGGTDDHYDALKHRGLTGPGTPANDGYEVIDGTADRWQQALAIASTNLADPANFAQLEELVDMESLIDYIIVNTTLANTDWPHKNWYAFGRRDGSDGGFKFSPWDSEYSLQNLGSNKINVGNNNTPARFYDRSRNNAEFRLRFADRVHKHLFNDGPLTVPTVVGRYAEMAAEIEPAINAEAARWGDLSNTRQGPRDFRKSHWLSARDTILNSFLPNRHAIILSQYRNGDLYPGIDAPEFKQHGGQLAAPYVITFPNPDPGTIYYTTDGSDPRLEGGAPNPLAGMLSEGGDSTETYTEFEETGWRYLVTGTGLSDSEVVEGSPAHASYGPGDWKHPDFNDSAWSDGQALLGYGTVGTRTRNTTIVYINGYEIDRNNMDAGNRSYGDFANQDADPEDEIISIIGGVPAGVLRATGNVLAIELHQESANSSDVGIDARVKGVVAGSGITLAGSSVVKARLLSASGEWSALTEATFVMSAPALASNLIISKIHYRPAEPSAAEIAAGYSGRSDFEYLELYNHGARPLSLAGVVISGAIDFAFAPNIIMEVAPGERVLLVANTAAFQMRYGTTSRIVGEFQSGKLSDDGEEIVVDDATNTQMWRFRYNAAGAWPDSPDGGGTALVLINPDSPVMNSDLGFAKSWRPSTSVGGSPGRDDRLFLNSWLATQADSDPLADPDGDGISQLTAFAIGALDDPNALNYLPIVSIEEINVGGRGDPYEVIEVRLLTGAAGITVSVQRSPDLSAWANADLVLLSSRDQGDGTLIQRYRSPLPHASETMPLSFFRIAVSALPSP